MTPYVKKEIISWIKTILFAVAFALFITKIVIVNAHVPTSSMNHTIPNPSRVVAFRLQYLFSKPQRYDVVVFKFPDNEEQLFVKRIIGLPGETVEIRQGKVYINGSDTPLPDDFTAEPPHSLDNGPYEVPEGHYFMMGDNRNSSDDSRRWNNTYVAEKKILGKVIFCYYPELKIIR